MLAWYRLHRGELYLQPRVAGSHFIWQPLYLAATLSGSHFCWQQGLAGNHYRLAVILTGIGVCLSANWLALTCILLWLAASFGWLLVLSFTLPKFEIDLTYRVQRVHLSAALALSLFGCICRPYAISFVLSLPK